MNANSMTPRMVWLEKQRARRMRRLNWRVVLLMFVAATWIGMIMHAWLI